MGEDNILTKLLGIKIGFEEKMEKYGGIENYLKMQKKSERIIEENIKWLSNNKDELSFLREKNLLVLVHDKKIVAYQLPGEFVDDFLKREEQIRGEKGYPREECYLGPVYDLNAPLY
jgi:hypothetical protein